MKIYVQWATNPKSAPEIIDSKDWKDIPKRPEPRNPKGTDKATSEKGWIQSICICGRIVKADHIAVIHNPQGYRVGSVKVVMWDDDPEERTPDETHAKEFVFEIPTLKTINNRKQWYIPQYLKIFCSSIMKQKMEASGQLPLYCQNKLVKVEPYSKFVKPPEDLTRHGIWLPEKLNEEMEKQESHSWHEWV